jgi:DNA adenine methylase
LIFTARSWLDLAMPNLPRPAEPAPKRAHSRRGPVRVKLTGEAQPFLKWAGGKSQLLEQFEPFFPTSIRSYCEPFLGGGAVFFHLKARFPKMKSALRDNNPELINCYEVVRDRVKQLMTLLDDHLAQFRLLGEPYYYKVRSLHKTAGAVERAARMIFLNKTCYNGLWRVNGKGEFNVPIGSYRPDRVALYDPANLLAASLALQDVDLRVQDFVKTVAAAQKGEFLYVDPPYFPLSRTSNFTSYTLEDFGLREQKELTKLVADACARGVQVMLSNSDTPETRELNSIFKLHRVQARRAVNCDGAKRGRVSELVALTFS